MEWIAERASNTPHRRATEDRAARKVIELLKTRKLDVENLRTE